MSEYSTKYGDNGHPWAMTHEERKKWVVSVLENFILMAKEDKEPRFRNYCEKIKNDLKAMELLAKGKHPNRLFQTRVNDFMRIGRCNKVPQNLIGKRGIAWCISCQKKFPFTHGPGLYSFPAFCDICHDRPFQDTGEDDPPESSD